MLLLFFRHLVWQYLNIFGFWTDWSVKQDILSNVLTWDLHLFLTILIYFIVWQLLIDYGNNL